VDVLFDGEKAQLVAAPRIDTPNTHGTGCSTASAIAAELAKGASLEQAVRAAKEYISEALARSTALRIGSGKQTPFNHGFDPCWLLFHGVVVVDWPRFKFWLGSREPPEDFAMP
jgi:hydroxymethylpyrimidine kinase/phosphomethylpyrimidine kinase/thiamine-phosphate diphosphorylase